MLLEVWESTGVKPPSLESRPTLLKHLEYPYSVFVDLSSSRTFDMGGNRRPLGIQLMRDYAWMYDLSQRETRDIWDSVKLIDAIWMGEVEKWQPKREKVDNTPKKGP